MILLVHPPVAKPCEPPAGIAKLYGVLNHVGVKCRLLDANIEGLLSLLNAPVTGDDPWTKRAYRNLPHILASLKTWQAYENVDRYKRTVKDLNHLLEAVGRHSEVRLTLSNYQHQKLSPVRSRDLIRAAEQPEENPFFSYFKPRFMEILERSQPSVVGFSLNYLSQALCTFAMIGFLRQECPGLTLALGGGLVTSWMKKPRWKNPFKGLVDHLVAGPGEFQLLSLMGIENNGKEHFPPLYDTLPLTDYLAPGPVLPYSASNGCYWNQCSFCPEKAEKNPYLPAPVSEVLDDINHLIKKTHPVLVHLLDNAISPALLGALAAHPIGLPWYGFVRVTSHLTDQNFCDALKASGCVMLKLGLESGDQSVLDHLQKGVVVEEASQVLRILKKAGIATYVYLLFGTLAETQAEARRTLDFVVTHSDYIDFLNLALFNLPVDGPEALMVETKRFYEGDLSLYSDFLHPKGWNRLKVREYLDKEFKRDPVVAAILRREPPLFTSNHAPFFVMHKGTDFPGYCPPFS